MAIKVEIEYCSGNDEMNKDRFRFIVFAKKQFARQIISGLKPVKRSWLSYECIKNKNCVVIPPLDILITLRQYIDGTNTDMHTFAFKQTDSFEDSMRPVLEQVKIWLRPRHLELVCSICGKGYRSVNENDTLCKSCWNKELKSFVNSVSDMVAGKTKGMHRSRGTVSTDKNKTVKKPDDGKDKADEQRPEMNMDENCNLVPAVIPDKDEKTRQVDLPPDITVPVKKRGRPKGVVLHDLRCLFCGNDFRSDNPRAVKCKPCTDSLRCHSCLKPVMRPDDIETLLCDSCADKFKKQAIKLLAEHEGKDPEVPDKPKIEVPEIDKEPIHTGREPDRIVKKLGRPKKVKLVEMHECKCLICDGLFLSDNPKALKCEDCTVSPKDVERSRLMKAKAVQLRKDKKKTYDKFNGDRFA